jgi:hypothetical protein
LVIGGRDRAKDVTAGMTDDEMTRRFQRAVQLAIEEKKAKGVPVPGYDAERKAPFLEYADGRKRYAGE